MHMCLHTRTVEEPSTGYVGRTNPFNMQVTCCAPVAVYLSCHCARVEASVLGRVALAGARPRLPAAPASLADNLEAVCIPASIGNNCTAKQAAYLDASFIARFPPINAHFL